MTIFLFCLEIYGEYKFQEVCPGKCEYIGQKKYLEAIEYCVKVFGKRSVSGELVAGLEPPS
ncbi:MAG: hypothetical protein PHC29_05870 [Candidatus Omnitrophica bacterium]|nr:hypothetical protein [Candidatus Omnitrophota bacterium]